jgi:hypothetical protein
MITVHWLVMVGIALVGAGIGIFMSSLCVVCDEEQTCRPCLQRQRQERQGAYRGSSDTGRVNPDKPPQVGSAVQHREEVAG